MFEISNRLYPPNAIDAGDLPAALSAFACREMLDYGLYGRFQSDVWICGFGVTLWLMGDRKGAGTVWSRACDEALKGKFRYSSTGTFQPGLLLWFASVWLKNKDWREEAGALFDKLLRKRQPVMGADSSILLAKLIRREIDLPQLQAAYRDRPPEIQESDEWSSLFYAGVRAYEDRDVKETRRLWARAKGQHKASLFFEYYLLEHERKRLDSRG